MIRRALAVGLAIASWSCQGELNGPGQPVVLDRAYFRCRVQPVLTKSCATQSCHGDGRRYFHVFARNRLRAQGEEKDRDAMLTDIERNANFESAKGMIDARDPGSSWLLMKPLEMSGGGYFHRGAEIFGGGNVFATKDDADYQVLQSWALGATDDPSCIEPGSDK